MAGLGDAVKPVRLPSLKARVFAKRYGRPGGMVPPGLVPSRRQTAAMVREFMADFSVMAVPPIGVVVATPVYAQVRKALRAVADFSFDAVRRKTNYATALRQWCALKRQARRALHGLGSRRSDRVSQRGRRA